MATPDCTHRLTAGFQNQIIHVDSLVRFDFANGATLSEIYMLVAERENVMAKINYTTRYGSTVTKENIEELESILDVSLPQDFINFITENNGCYINPHCYYVNNRLESINNFYDVCEAYEFRDLELPDYFIPIARDAGGNQSCINMSNDDYGKIYFIDHEIEDRFELISNSFSDFLSLLIDNPEL